MEAPSAMIDVAHMEYQTLVNWGVYISIAVGGWFCKQIWDAVGKLKEDIHKIEVDLPSIYIRKDEFADSMKEIKNMLNKIFDKLDEKADK